MWRFFLQFLIVGLILVMLLPIVVVVGAVAVLVTSSNAAARWGTAPDVEGLRSATVADSLRASAWRVRGALYTITHPRKAGRRAFSQALGGLAGGAVALYFVGGMFWQLPSTEMSALMAIWFACLGVAGFALVAWPVIQARLPGARTYVREDGSATMCILAFSEGWIVRSHYARRIGSGEGRVLRAAVAPHLQVAAEKNDVPIVVDAHSLPVQAIMAEEFPGMKPWPSSSDQTRFWSIEEPTEDAPTTPATQEVSVENLQG